MASKANIVRVLALSLDGEDYSLGNEPWYDEGWEPNPDPLATDCSGLPYGVFRKAGVLVNGRIHDRVTANDLYHEAKRISQPTEVGDLGFLLDQTSHCYHTFMYVGKGQVVEAGFNHKVRVTTPAVENARGAVWGRLNTDIGELEDDMEEAMRVEVAKMIREQIDIVYSDQVGEAEVYLMRPELPILGKKHDYSKAASIGFVLITAARILKAVGK